LGEVWLNPHELTVIPAGPAGAAAGWTEAVAGVAVAAGLGPGVEVDGLAVAASAGGGDGAGPAGAFGFGPLGCIGLAWAASGSATETVSAKSPPSADNRNRVKLGMAFLIAN